MTQKQQNIALGVSVLGIIGYFAFFHGTTTGNGVDPTGNGTGNDNSNFNAFRVATDLYDAMKESGTDEDAIVGILTNVSPAQFDLVFKAFGSLAYNPNLGNQWGIWALDKYDLKGWLKNELSETEYQNQKRKFSNKL